VNRRAFVAASVVLLTAPLAGQPQPVGKPARIGHLSSLDAPTVNHAAFMERLQQLGWVEGRNLSVENRFAARDGARLKAFAEELARLPVDLLFTSGGAESAQAARLATTTIPIVFAMADDPVAAGLIPSLSRPAANVTGVSSMNAQLDMKRLALLKEALPLVRRVGVLWSPVDPAGASEVRATETAARSLGLHLHLQEVRTPRDLDGAFASARQRGAGAVMILGSPTLYEYQRRIGELAAMTRLPAISAWRQLPEAGGLMSYGADVQDMFRRAAVFVDRILRGARPADLPVEQPTKFELVINLKTAKALGLTIPQSMLLRADEVIQ